MRPLPLLVLTALVACNGPAATDDTSAGDDTGNVDDGVPSSYVFTTRGGEGSSVSYSGQIARHVLVHDLEEHIGDLTERIDGGWYPAEGDVEDELNFYFEFDSTTSGTLAHDISYDLPTLQTTYDDVSSGKDLVGKLAGNDPVGQHADWSTEFVGWEDDDVTTPESLVRAWFDILDEQAVAWGNGDYPQGPDGTPVPAVHVTPQGHDLQELTQKFLVGALLYSQAADDYLDDDTDGKGLLSDHASVSGDKSYTELEHAWDEGFGYFGASRTYGTWTDDQIGAEAMDVDGDGKIDLASEACFGMAVYAAKRDLGSSSTAPTDFTMEAWEGFVAGRHLIATAETSLTDDELAELQGYRDQAVGAWEKVFAASVVHYINETLVDMDAIGTDDYDFGRHAKHWSELKGLALAFQFNPRSKLNGSDFATLHDLIGIAPVLPGAGDTELAGYRSDLFTARAMLGTTYGFDSTNLGDDNGLDGW